MPYTIKKRKGGGYTVRSPHGVKAKKTTKKKAKAQIRAIGANRHGKR